MKQNLNIRRFLGQSENAVKIQILTALIAYLLVDRYRERHRLSQSLSLLLAELSITLFSRPECEEHVVNRYQRRRQAFEQRQGCLGL